MKKSQDYWIYGLNPVFAALKNKSRSCHKLLCTNDVLTKYSTFFEKLTKDKGITPQEVTKKYIKSLLETNSRHQGIIAKVKNLPDKKIENSLKSFSKNSILLALDQISDPQNVGAIIRSSVIFGCEGIIITKNNSPQESGLLAKSAAGALEIANIFRIPNLARTLTELKKNNFWVIGLDSDTKKNLNTINTSGPIVIVIGSEGKGLRSLTKKVCDSSFTIEMTKQAIENGIDSLNVSNATSIALYAINEQRKKLKISNS
ncbi:MAG: 23S rRNA (guanosine(2251)-2'-O)-methyltransferase RlmB [Rhodospirillaceae bacterium]|nr:23S rRNA (guanosine(2251)-2'-O)-methyltransferase RlmB [Rhodospirillaceae bacterium]|tara:strand:+ start:42248 stop:43024 length:777 start_codon:yes stop_codon:yes gene_type:complete